MKFTKQELSEALYANCGGGAVAACKILIEMGADPRAISITDGESPLHAAALIQAHGAKSRMNATRTHAGKSP